MTDLRSFELSEPELDMLRMLLHTDASHTYSYAHMFANDSEDYLRKKEGKI